MFLSDTYVVQLGEILGENLKTQKLLVFHLFGTFKFKLEIWTLILSGNKSLFLKLTTFRSRRLL